MHAHTLLCYTNRQYIDEVVGQERVHEAPRTCTCTYLDGCKDDCDCSLIRGFGRYLNGVGICADAGIGIGVMLTRLSESVSRPAVKINVILRFLEVTSNVGGRR